MGERYIKAVQYVNSAGDVTNTVYNPTDNNDYWTTGTGASHFASANVVVFDFNSIGQTRMVSTSPVYDGATTTEGFYATWWVDAGAETHMYALASSSASVTGVDLVKTVKKKADGNWETYTGGTNVDPYYMTWDALRTNVAVMDADKNVTFKAVYTDKGGVQRDAEGNLLFLEAKGKFLGYVNEDALKKANEYAYGLYEVQFEFPDGTKSDSLKVGIAADPDAYAAGDTDKPTSYSAVIKGGVIVAEKQDPWAKKSCRCCVPL
jgi:hypothetical protein